MSSGPLPLLDFQEQVVAGVLARIETARSLLAALPARAEPALRARIARKDGAVMLYAPTGAGKTVLAVEVLARLPQAPPTLWFWFAPFAGLVEQARLALQRQAPALRLLDLDTDRRLEHVQRGGIFVTTWQSVAAANQAARRSRTRGDAGSSLDELLVLARAEGLHIGCVVDEAHHGFHKAKEARAFFTEVLRPDLTLMLTATPRDRDAATFERDTGWQIGGPERWITVARQDGVDAGLLKRGVRVVRFVAPDNDIAALVDFERTALEQCTAMHRRLGQTLREAGIGLTPLMLVQAPDGDKAMAEARRLLVEHLGFPESAVRIHTAREPDPDLVALAQDPSVEVLIFKMAVALGFDAPRAFTLAALRGARDRDFGIQVIGRLMRVHPLLRRRPDLPAELFHGYVFLANADAQEGLLAAGQAIAELSTQVPELGTQSVVTVIGASHSVQVLRSGESASLLVDQAGVHLAPGSTEGEEAAPSEALQALAQAANAMLPLVLPLAGGGPSASATGAPATAQSALPALLASDAARTLVYRLRDEVPRTLISEYLPPAAADRERQVAAHVDFSPAVLGAMHQTLAQLLRVERDVFAGMDEDRESYVLAQLDAVQVAARVDRQFGLFDLDKRALLQALTERFAASLRQAGFAAPDDEEALDHALDLVLARNPHLLRDAFRLACMQQVGERGVELPLTLSHPERLAPARRNVYGVFPPGFDSSDERDFAALLDRSDEVLWWHRNPARRADSLALFRWDDGRPFHPDFVVGVRDRNTRDHVALVEVKGPRGWGDPVDLRKADGPAHPCYGRCVFVGREKGGGFRQLRSDGTRLQPYAAFEPTQLRWAD